LPKRERRALCKKKERRVLLPKRESEESSFAKERERNKTGDQLKAGVQS